MANKRNGSGDSNSPAPKKPRPEESKRLTPPLLSPSDKKEYRHLQLPNGLRVLLISDPSLDANPIWSNKNFEDHSMRLVSEHKIRDVLSPNLLQLELSIDMDKSGLMPPSSSGANFLPRDVHNIEHMKHSSSGSGGEANLSRQISVAGKAAMCLIVDAGSVNDPPQYEGLAHFTEHMIHYGSKKQPSDAKIFNFIYNHGCYINAYTQGHSTAYQIGINPDFLKEGLEMFSYCISEPLFDPNTTRKEVQSVDNEFLLRSASDNYKINDFIRSTMKKGHPLRKFSCGNIETLKGDDELLRQLQQFHAVNYVAKRMTFAIQSTDSLDTLQEMVESSMNCIQSGTSIEPIEQQSISDVFDEVSFSKLYKIQGERKLYLIWKFDSSVWKDSESKPLQFLATLMNDCGVDRLSHIFIERGWITGMNSVCLNYDFAQNNYCSIFTNVICLTESGERNLDRIVQYVFDFIDMLLDTPEHFFEDRWEEAKACSKQSWDHCGNGTPLSNTHFAARKMMTHGPEATFLSKDIVFEGEYKPEPLIAVLNSIAREKTLYIQFTSELPKNLTKNTMQHSKFEYTTEEIPGGFLNKVEDLKLQFPDKNPFITRRIRPNAQPFDLPDKQDEKLSVSVKHTRGITTSKCRYHMYILSPESERTPFHRQLLSLLTYLLQFKMSNELTLASVAGIKTKLGQCAEGMILSLVGFPENMHDVLRRFCEIFNEEAFPIKTFEILKQIGQLDYTASIKSPENLLSHLDQSLAMVDQKSILETPNKISTLTQDSFTEYIRLFMSSMYISCTLEGNVSATDVLDIRELLQGIPYEQAATETFDMEPTNLFLPGGERTIRIRAVNSNNCNNIVRNLYQIPVHDPENQLMCNIAVSLMQAPAFTILRTRLQLAYSVYVMASRETPVKFSITLQTPGTKYTVCSLNKKIDAFLITFYDEFLSRMNEKEFRNCKINMNLKVVVTLDSLKAWYVANIYDPKFNKLRKLSMQVIGSSLPNVGKECTCAFCSAIEFKRSRNTDVEFAKYKKPINIQIAKTHKLIENIAKFHEEEVRM